MERGKDHGRYGLIIQLVSWTESVPSAVAGGCAAFRSVAAQLRTHPLPQVVLTLSKEELDNDPVATALGTDPVQESRLILDT